MPAYSVSKVERFEDIEAWQLGRKLTKQVYVLTQNEPFSRDYGLRDQIQRASGSIMHNIVEGFDTMYELAETTRGKTAGFVEYLLEFETKKKASKV